MTRFSRPGKHHQVIGYTKINKIPRLIFYKLVPIKSSKMNKLNCWKCVVLLSSVMALAAMI